jgi:hypothetical protein
MFHDPIFLTILTKAVPSRVAAAGFAGFAGFVLANAVLVLMRYADPDFRVTPRATAVRNPANPAKPAASLPQPALRFQLHPQRNR